GAPIVSTVTNPGALSPAGTSESFNGGTGGNTNLSQTFTLTATNYTLQTIDLYAGGGTGTGIGTNLTLNLYDLGSQTAPNPSSYSGGAAYRNLAWINGNNARDFALAVYGSVYTGGVTNPAASASASIEWNNVRQQIDGFGASSAWRSTWSSSAANMFFSANIG